MKVIDLATVGFAEALALQERLVADIVSGTGEETLLLLEHPPVYTIGSGGNSRNMLDAAVPVRRINRGGDVTYHGPGQVVGYPLIDLGRRGRDLHCCLRFFEEVIMAVARAFQVPTTTVAGRTGVWTEKGKLASIGVGVRRWVTMHGFALNVTREVVEGFGKIHPCGIVGCPMTSLEGETRRAIATATVKHEIGACFAEKLAHLLPVTERRPL